MASTYANNWKGGRCLCAGLPGGCRGQGELVDVDLLQSGMAVCSNACHNRLNEAAALGPPAFMDRILKHGEAGFKLLSGQKTAAAVQQYTKERKSIHDNLLRLDTAASECEHKKALAADQRMKAELQSFSFSRGNTARLRACAATNDLQFPHIAESLNTTQNHVDTPACQPRATIRMPRQNSCISCCTSGSD